MEQQESYSCGVKIFDDRVIKTKKYSMVREYYIGKLLNMIDPDHFAKPISHTQVGSNYHLEMVKVKQLECKCVNDQGKACDAWIGCECPASIKNGKREVIKVLANFPVEFTHYDLHGHNFIVTETGVVIIDFGQSYLNIPQAEDYLGIERSKVNYDKYVETTEWRMRFGRIPTIYDPCYDILYNTFEHIDLADIEKMSMYLSGREYLFDDISTWGLPYPWYEEDDNMLDLSDMSGIEDIFETARQYVLANFKREIKITTFSKNGKIVATKIKSDLIFGEYDTEIIEIGQVGMCRINKEIDGIVSCHHYLSPTDFKDRGMNVMLQKIFIHQKLKILKNPHRKKVVRDVLNQLKIPYSSRYDS